MALMSACSASSRPERSSHAVTAEASEEEFAIVEDIDAYVTVGVYERNGTFVSAESFFVGQLQEVISGDEESMRKVVFL